MQNYRHGDLPITPVTELNGTKITHHGSYVLALGEATGHKHIITAQPDMMDIYDIGNGMFMLDLRSEATISHEEHHTITLPPGKYRVGREREYDHFAHIQRQVID